MLHCFILGTAAKILTKPRKHQNPRKAESLWTLPKALKTSLRHTPGTFSCSYCETLKIGYPDPRSTLGSISSWEATIRHKPWNLLNKVTKNNIKGVSIAFLRISTDAPGHCPCQVPPCWKPQLLHFLAVEESNTFLLLAQSHQHLSPVPTHDVGPPSQEDFMEEETSKERILSLPMAGRLD